MLCIGHSSCSLLGSCPWLLWSEALQMELCGKRDIHAINLKLFCIHMCVDIHAINLLCVHMCVVIFVHCLDLCQLCLCSLQADQFICLWAATAWWSRLIGFVNVPGPLLVRRSTSEANMPWEELIFKSFENTSTAKKACCHQWCCTIVCCTDGVTSLWCPKKGGPTCHSTCDNSIIVCIVCIQHLQCLETSKVLNNAERYQQ